MINSLVKYADFIVQYTERFLCGKIIEMRHIFGRVFSVAKFVCVRGLRRRQLAAFLLDVVNEYKVRYISVKFAKCALCCDTRSCYVEKDRLCAT
jgi:hypothetical protein